MATPEIRKPNYTQVPNAILDNLDKFTPAEVKVVMAIARQTFGFHQKRKKMSLSFMVNGTGMTKHTVLTALESLIERDIVRRRKSGQSFEYSLNIVDELVQKLHQSDDSTSAKIAPEVVQNLHQFGPTSAKIAPEVVQNLHTIKETLKETSLFKEKKESDSPSNVIPPKLRTQLVNALLDTTGKRRMADAGDDNVLNRAHDDVVILWNMGFKSGDQIFDLAENWKRNDWRGQKGNTPTPQQLKEHASQHAPSTAPKKREIRKVEFIDSFTGQTVIEEVTV